MPPCKLLRTYYIIIFLTWQHWDRPGELLKIAEILARMNANVVKLGHNQFKNSDRFLDVQLEVTVETNGHKHIAEIVSELNKEGYTITRV